MKEKKKNNPLNGSLLLLTWMLFFNVRGNVFAQKHGANTFSVMFYNVENLFDCYDDSLKSDGEFLPESKKKWTFSRYNTKVNKIAKVILASNKWEPPALVGLCEVENSAVLGRLVWETGLSETGYRFIHHESPDRRGIDVALLFRKDRFKIITEYPVSVSIPEKNFYSRDILYVKGIAFKQDTLNVFVCHLPSKYGGAISSEWKRDHVASVLRSFVDSLLDVNVKCHILIMGDMNETPGDEAVNSYLKAVRISDPGELVNLSYNLLQCSVSGTYKYHGHWEVIDQIIVSRSLVEKPFAVDGMYVIDLPFLLEKDKSYSGMKPYRTYLGPRYLGGFSDHLPVKAVIRKER